MRHFAWGIAVVVCGLGCAHAPECSAHGGPRWTELRTPHFLIRTGLGLAEARETALALERSHAAVRVSFPELPADLAPIDVLLLKNELQVEALIDRHFVTGVVGGDFRGAQLVLSADDYLSGQHVDVPHLNTGLALHFARYAFRRLPRWFALGYAAYLSTITIDAPTNTAYRGKMDRRSYDLLFRWGVLPLDALWALDEAPRGSPEVEAHRQASAWAVMHWLENARRAELDRFMASLKAGVAPLEAWRRELGELSSEVVRAAVTEHLERGQFTGQLIDLRTSPAVVSERPLADAEVHTTFARLLAQGAQWDRAANQVDLAKQLDPSSAAVWEAGILVERDAATRLVLARRHAARSENDAVAQLLLALNLPRADPERLAALERAVALDPDSPIALSELALERVAGKQLDAALTLGEHAVALAPYSTRVLAAWAFTLRAGGHCPEAAAALKRAIDFARGDGEVIERLVKASMQLAPCEQAPPSSAQ